MADSRMQSPLWASTASRHLVNEPAVLALSRAGLWPTGSVDAVVKSLSTDRLGTPFTCLGPFQQVCEWVKANKVQFPYLTEQQMTAIRVYTLVFPEYFKELNTALFNFENSQNADPEITRWADFIHNLDSGLANLRAKQTRATSLKRIAWIPEGILNQFYTEGKDIVLKGCTSTSTSEQWQFLNVAPNDVIGKKAVLLEFDEEACKLAANIAVLSAVPGEAEWLFPPFSRFVVSGIDEVVVPTSGLKIPRIRLRVPPSVDQLPAVLDNRKATAAHIVTLALVIALHAPPQSAGLSMVGDAIGSAGAVSNVGDILLDTILSIERALAIAAVPIEPASVDEMWKGFFRAVVGVHDATGREMRESWNNGRVGWAASDALLFLLFRSPLALIFTPYVAGLSYATRCFNREEAIFNECVVDHDAMEKERHRRWTEVERRRREMLERAAKVREDLELESQLCQKPPDFKSMFKQLGMNAQSYRRDIQNRIRGDKSGVAAEAEEIRLLTNWVYMTIETHMIDVLIQGGLASAFESAFPLDADPVQTTLTVGDKAFVAVPGDRFSAAQYAVARLTHLRLMLSRFRIVVPVGNPDAGKSSLLRKVYKINVPAGLDEKDRTLGISFHPHPIFDLNHSPVLLADCPGFGDKVAPRNDVVGLVAALASEPSFAGLVKVIVVQKSGRDVKTEMDRLKERLAKNDIFYVITHVDQEYENRVVSAWENLKAKSPGEAKSLKKDPDRRKAIADALIKEDSETLHGCDFVYTCLGGWGASLCRSEEDSSDDEISPAFPYLKDDLKNFFTILGPADIQTKIDELIGIES